MASAAAPARTFAYRILYDVLVNGAYANISINKNIGVSLKNEADRSLCVNIVYGTLKKKNRLDKALASLSDKPVSSLDKPAYIILLMSLYQLLYLKKVPPYAVVNDAVNMCRFYKVGSAASFTNAVLRGAMRRGGELTAPEADPAEYLYCEYGFERWLTKLLSKQYGSAFVLEYAKESEKPSHTYIRVNALKTDEDALIKKLAAENITAVKTDIPLSLMITSGINIFAGKAYREGLFYAQDISGAISAYALCPEKGMRYLDMCAAPGSKTFNAAILSQNAEVLSCDISANKLGLLSRSAKQLGLTGVTAAIADASKPREELSGKFDRVICDVPCSGLGVIKRKPEILRSITQAHLEKLYELQQKILLSGLDALAPGGILIYSTCTINKYENEAVIKNVLEKQKNIKLSAVALPFELKSEHPEMKKGILCLDPLKDGCDGFFIAKLTKVK